MIGEEKNDIRVNRCEDNMFIVQTMIERCNREGKKGYFAYLIITYD